MQPKIFLQMDEGMEHEEHLYLLEILVDNLKVVENRVPAYLLEPYGPLIVRAKFLDFPNLEFDQGKCSDFQGGVDVPSVAGQVIAGAPQSWKLEFAKDQPDFEKYPQYRVTIPVIKSSEFAESGVQDEVRTLVPQSAIMTGEGLRYINAVLKSELDPETLAQIHKQIEEEMSRKGPACSDKICEYTFSAGKSILFPMTPYNLIQKIRKSPIYLQVTRSGMYADDKPFFTLIGQVKLLLGEAFVRAIMAAGNTKVLPVSAHIDDKYPISNVFGEETGIVSVFLRLSCFGKSVYETEKEIPPPKQYKMQSQFICKKKFCPMYADEMEKELCPEGGTSTNLDGRYTVPVPWRKPWDEMPEFPKPVPVLPAFYEPLPPLPPPPPPTKPFDIGEHLPNLPRCSPRQPPPCYRRAGDAPMSYCTKDIEAQIRREELTKFTQTDSELQLKSKKSFKRQETVQTTEDKDTKYVSITKNFTMSRGRTVCDGNLSRNDKFKFYDNKFDGGPTKFENEESRDKNCTCPKIPDILLPQKVCKQQCGCRCAALNAMVSQTRKIGDIFRKVEKSGEAPKTMSAPNGTKTTEIPIKKNEQTFEDKRKNSITEKKRKDSKTFDQKLLECPESLKGKKVATHLDLPKKQDDLFYMPGTDSSTFIALTTEECGYDIKRYMKSIEDAGDPDEAKKYLNNNPLLDINIDKMPTELRNAVEKDAKKMVEKKSIKIEDLDKPAIKKTTKIDNRDKQRQDDKSKPYTSNDGGGAEETKTEVNTKEIRTKEKIRASNIYEYTSGMYPGINVGHKYCVRPLRLVPKTMGWLWNISDLGGILKPGRGWRPGAVRKNVNNLLKEWRKNNKGGREIQEQEMENVMNVMSNKPKRLRPGTPKSQGSKKEGDGKLNPTIHLHKKDRFFYVSMYPVKTESQDEMGEEPQPIQFKIDRKHPDGKISDDESCQSSDTSSDSSSYEVEYIAPAALKAKKRKVDKTHMFSQYNEDDFTPKKLLKKGPKPDEQPQPEKKGEKKGKKGKGKGKKKGGKKDKKGGKKKK